jgi:hypothetical protein
MFDKEIRPLDWAFQRKHSNQFRRYKNHNKYSPATNTAANAEREEAAAKLAEVKPSVPENPTE